jgi:hypothetical protein
LSRTDTAGTYQANKKISNNNGSKKKRERRTPIGLLNNLPPTGLFTGSAFPQGGAIIIDDIPCR